MYMYQVHLHRTLIAIALSGNGLWVKRFQLLHVSSDPLSALSKVTTSTPPLPPVDVMLVFPLYHWYFADGCFVSHVKDCGIPDITLIEFGVDCNNTWSIGTETTDVRLGNKMLISNTAKMYFLIRNANFEKESKILLLHSKQKKTPLS